MVCKQFKKYQADIAQEDGSEKSETVDEIKNILQVTFFYRRFLFLTATMKSKHVIVF